MDSFKKRAHVSRAAPNLRFLIAFVSIASHRKYFHLLKLVDNELVFS